MSLTDLFKFDPNSNSITASTQESLPIETIVENLVVLKSGVVVVVLQTTAVNFDLLSEYEQTAKIKSFAGLINSLNFNMQILVRTHKVDVSNYVKRLKQVNTVQLSAELRREIEIYTQFVKNMIVTNEVLDKKFYIVVPDHPGVVQKTSQLKQLFGKKERIINVDQILEKAKARLFPKRDHIIKQLSRVGIKLKV